jgi:hypothetical protein
MSCDDPAETVEEHRVREAKLSDGCRGLVDLLEEWVRALPV